MRDFERAASRLRRLPVMGRIVYSTFLVLTLAALALTAWLADDMVGLGLSRIDEYYAGAPPSGGDLELGTGPDIEMPDENEALAPGEPMSRRKLLEVTHFHLFSMPLYLLVLSHLYMLSGAARRSKRVFIGGGTAGVVLHVAAPWAATSGGAAAAALYGASGLAMLVSFGWMSLVSLWDMWAPSAA